MTVAISKNQIPIRLTEERWHHISTGHPEIADYYFEILETIEKPQTIYEGNEGGLIANKNSKARKYYGSNRCKRNKVSTTIFYEI